MSDSIFVAADGRFTPTEHARGPWDAGALHGGAPAALLTSAFERLQPGAELRIARLGFEFLRPIPLAPLKLSLRIVRPGRRVQELAGELSVLTDAPTGEQVVCRASALRVREIPPGVPASDPMQTPHGEGPGTGVGTGVGVGMGTPQTSTPLRFALNGSTEASFATSAMEMRSRGEGGRDAHTLGPGQVWMRPRVALLAGEELTPLARLAATSDFGNGISAVLPFEQFLFINADLTIHVHRPPRGEWIGLDARTLVRPGDMGLAESVLHDLDGPVGRAFQTLVVEPR
ncbi:MAG TPA: thioesterase family protein [Solirubrobacteraceae bacterium]|nr:thioesterase family protein [Solirubrobacteraceae bacterium]